ncbi:MAG: hypothetical protein M1153_00580 [Patescibacteria group bacterium]|nr:hypothetical protein [Patescibacteria group bacterium]
MPEYPNNLSGIQSQLLRERLPVGWPWRFLTAMFIIFLAVSLTYLGLQFGYGPLLSKKINVAENQINTLTNSILTNQSQTSLNVYSQIVNIERLLGVHVNSENFLPFLSSLTNPKVSYTSINVSVAQSELGISGVAASYAVLAEQLQAYQSSPAVRSATLQNSQASGNAIIFNVKLLVNPSVFSYSLGIPGAATSSFSTLTSTATQP